jgi:polysaccharide biosynthesis transport protein
MPLRDYWEILRRSWMLIVGTTVVGGLAALGLSLLKTPLYQAQADLFVSVQSADEISGAYTGGLYVQQRIKSYVTLVDTPGVLEPVIDQLGLDTTSTELGTDVAAQNPTGTVLLYVTASDVDATQAVEIADAAAASLAKEIVRLETTESGAKPVKAELIRPAELPTQPVAPRTQLNVIIGLLLGLMGGAAIAVLRATLDTSIKSVEDLRDATQTTVLGAVAYDSGAGKNPLVTLQGTPRAEAYRSIRTNLQYVDVDHPPRCVVITSSVPQEGKSTTAANLAIALAQGGSKVLLVEADLRRPRVAEYLGVEGSVGLTDVLIGHARLDDAIIPWQRGLLDFLPSGAIPPNPSELLGSQQLADLLTELRTRYSMLILDAPPLLPVTDAAILTTASDGAILVARHGETRREQAEQAAAALAQVSGRLIGTVLNFVPEKRRARGYDYGYGYGYGQPSKGKGTAVRGRRVLTHDNVPAPEPHA